MRKGTKIIQIAGFRGIMMVLFIGTCLAAGFIIFPAKVAMYLWNNIAASYFAIPVINIWQGLLLWAGVALGCYIANGGNLLISCHEPAQLNEDDMRVLMERIRLQAQARRLNSMLMKADSFKEITKQNESENTETKQVSEDINEKKS